MAYKSYKKSYKKTSYKNRSRSKSSYKGRTSFRKTASMRKGSRAVMAAKTISKMKNSVSYLVNKIINPIRTLPLD
jgi:hypothetical protein